MAGAGVWMFARAGEVGVTRTGVLVEKVCGGIFDRSKYRLVAAVLNMEATVITGTTIATKVITSTVFFLRDGGAGDAAEG